MKNLDLFMHAYMEHLEKAVVSYPREYAYSIAEAPKVAERMRGAFEKGSYNKDSRAIKATCKQFAIKHTYQAINEFLNGGAL